MESEYRTKSTWKLNQPSKISESVCLVDPVVVGFLTLFCHFQCHASDGCELELKETDGRWGRGRSSFSTSTAVLFRMGWDGVGLIRS